jgi:hypothetical protein
MRTFFSSIDYFAVTFNFRIGKNDKYGAMTGGLLFILYIVIAITYILLTGLDFLSGKNIDLSFIERSVYPPPEMQIDNMNFSVALRLTFDNDTDIFDSTYKDYFTFTSNLVSIKDSNKTKTKTLIKP